MKGLTQKQRDILGFIQSYIDKHRFSPSYREIMTHFSYSSPGSVYKHIQTLQRKGVLTNEKQCSRSVLPTQSAPTQERRTDIQLPFIGYVSAGYPIEMFIQSQKLMVPSFLVANPENTYVLRVRGNSLNEECMADGDFLVIEARQSAQSGEMVIGLINQQDTIIKHYYAEGQYVRLEGHTSKPMILRTEHLVIQGIVVGLFRSY